MSPMTLMPWVRDGRCELCGGPGPLELVALELERHDTITVRGGQRRVYRATRGILVCERHWSAGMRGAPIVPPRMTTARPAPAQSRLFDDLAYLAS